MATFSKALEYLKANKIVKREVIKNDTVIVKYKNKLCQMSKDTGIRYPYTPTDEDLLADDWFVLHEKKQNINSNVWGDFVINALIFHIKDQIAKDMEYNNWDQCIENQPSHKIDSIINKVCLKISKEIINCK